MSSNHIASVTWTRSGGVLLTDLTRSTTLQMGEARLVPASGLSESEGGDKGKTAVRSCRIGSGVDVATGERRSAGAHYCHFSYQKQFPL